MVLNRIGSAHLHFTSIRSTNDYAVSLVSKIRPIHGTVISASFQDNGRGQIGRSWESAPGKNACLSIILYPEITASDQFQLNATIALSLRSFVAKYLTTPVTIKWPNDIYVGKNKIAGILIQNAISGQQIRYCVVGIGLNVNQLTFPGSIPNPTSLAKESGTIYPIPEILLCLFDQLSVGLDRMNTQTIQQTLSDYEERVFRKNEVCEFIRTQTDDSFKARILGVDSSGRIRLDEGKGEYTYAFNEIRLKTT